jgi:DNA-binding MarR family transcriptional regulator
MKDDDDADVVVKIFKMLREKAIKILMVIREEDGIRWKELQEKTQLSTATFNRALAALQEVNFIRKDDADYHLTWTGRLVTDGLLLFGLRITEEMDEVEEAVAEDLLAKDMVMAIVFVLFVSLKKRGKLHLSAFERAFSAEMRVIGAIFDAYAREGYLEISEGWIYATGKMDEMDVTALFS